MNQLKKTSVWVPVIVASAFILGLLAGDLLNKESGPTATQKKVQTILNLIKNDYVDDVNLDSLLEHTLPELLSNLDPHSAYIPAADLTAVDAELESTFCGIGVHFTVDNDTIVITDVVFGGPSEKVGLKAGDRIVKVDGENVAGMGFTNEQLISRLRGECDTPVKLGVLRYGSKKLANFEVIRGQLPNTSVDAVYMISPEIGYLRVTKFARSTYDEFFQALNELKRDGAKSYVIDLRGNVGGFMEIAFLMANEFLEKGMTIASTRGREYYTTKAFPADGNGSFKDSQVVVLIDELSASSSEIFAGALQDNDRALIIGRRSFGKGLIQRQSVLPDSSAVRLTVGRYYTPSGRCIQKDYSDRSQYDRDFYNRFIRGEMFSEDSVKLDKTKKFQTLNGRTVYGGGGIMPDIFVPEDTSHITNYYLTVQRQGLFHKFAFEYVDANRTELEKATTPDQLMALLPADPVLLRQFVTFAARNGVQARWYYINISQDLIVNQLKALIARDVLGYNAYFNLINRNDNNVTRAVREITEGAAAFPIAPRTAAHAKQPAATLTATRAKAPAQSQTVSTNNE